MAETFGVGLESADVDFAASSLKARIRERAESAASFRASAGRWESEGGFELLVAVRGPSELGATVLEGGPQGVGARIGGESGVAGEGDGSGDPPGQTGGEGGGTRGGGPPVQVLAVPGAGVAQAVASLVGNVFNRFARKNSRDRQVGDSPDAASGSGSGSGGRSGRGNAGGGGRRGLAGSGLNGCWVPEAGGDRQVQAEGKGHHQRNGASAGGKRAEAL